MKGLANQLRGFSERLGLSDAEVARRAGLNERQYGFYAKGDRIPKLDALVRLARVLGVTPNDLLGWTNDEGRKTKRSVLKHRLSLAADGLSDIELEILVAQAEALTPHGRRAKSAKRRK